MAATMAVRLCSLYADLPPESLETVIRSSIKKIGENRKCRSGARLVRNLMIAKVVRKAKQLMLTVPRLPVTQTPQSSEKSAQQVDMVQTPTMLKSSENLVTSSIPLVPTVNSETTSPTSDQTSQCDSSIVTSSHSSMSKKRHHSSDSESSTASYQDPESISSSPSSPPLTKLPRLELLDLNSNCPKPIEVDSDNIENREPGPPTSHTELNCSKDAFPCKMECDSQSFITVNSCTLISTSGQPSPLYCLSMNKSDFLLNGSSPHLRTIERSMVHASS